MDEFSKEEAVVVDKTLAKLPKTPMIVLCVIGLWRRERDLNPRGKIPRDFQSRALPGYAISAYLRGGLLPV